MTAIDVKGQAATGMKVWLPGITPTHKEGNFEEWGTRCGTADFPRPNGTGLDIKLTAATGAFGHLWEE